MAMSEPPTAMQVRARAYQLEMWEASLKENIIVAVSDATGSRAINSNKLPDGHWKRENSNAGSTRLFGTPRTDFKCRRRALLRISTELEVCPASKVDYICLYFLAIANCVYQMIWFLAPTVALCEQQYKVLSLHLPTIRIRLVVGSDNVDKWSTQQIWNIALSDVRVVVSTHQVLADALSNGFVVMERLALIVFDEG
jgi:ERCC4-related helicase